MPFNGSGVYSTTNPPPFTYNTVISETQVNAAFTDLAAALSLVLVRDGQAAMTGPLNMGSQVINALGNGTAGSPALKWGESQGFYRNASGELGFAAGGALVITFKATGLVTPAVLASSTLDFGSSTANWRIDTSNRLTNTGNTQPAFMASTSASITSGGSGTILVFDSEQFDNGGVYNNSTGVFTAPVAGRYHVSCNVTVQQTAGDAGTRSLGIYLSKSSSPTTFGETYFEYTSTGGQIRVLSFSGVLQLAASETVSVKWAPVNSLSATLYVMGSNGRSNFSAYLLG